MKTLLVLVLSAALLVVASAFPSQRDLNERPAPPVYLILHDEMPSSELQHIPSDLHPRMPGHHLLLTGENDENSEDQWNEPTVEQDSVFGPLSSTTIARSRRSTQPGAPGVGGQQGSGGGDRGGVDVSVSRGEAGGRRVEARGEGNVWQSRDGRGRVDVHGHYSRDYGGRYGTGRPQYGGGIRYSHRF